MMAIDRRRLGEMVMIHDDQGGGKWLECASIAVPSFGRVERGGLDVRQPMWTFLAVSIQWGAGQGVRWNAASYARLL